jgi:biotin operon repressor
LPPHERIFVVFSALKRISELPIDCLGELEARIRVEWSIATADKDQLLTPTIPQSATAEKLQRFGGGEMVFFPDRVELCGVDICRGPRSETRRQFLELLSRQVDGRNAAYSGEEIAEQLKLARGAAAGLVRDLRDQIVASLRDQAGIESGPLDVILSRGAGYRLAPSISICREKPTVQGDAPESGVPNDPDASDPDDPDRADPDVPDGDPNDRDGPVGATVARQAWILQQLAKGRELRAPDVAKNLKCSIKTAKRALKSLKDAGKIVFVGDARTGSYQLRPPPRTRH